jgi:hypothetical protein
MSDSLTIERRFCGPPQSANGGYFAGRVAALTGRSVGVRLLKPPPLELPLAVRTAEDGRLEVLCGAELVAHTCEPRLEVPAVSSPDYLAAIEASRHYVGFAQHPFPTCFVCGPQRARGDGLRIFAGPMNGAASLPHTAAARVAAPWVADESLDGGDGKVRPEFMWAALDCPGWFAAAPLARVALLGELAAHIDRRVHVGERCVVIGWRSGGEGRKHHTGTALFDEDQVLCAYARATWIELRAE